MNQNVGGSLAKVLREHQCPRPSGTNTLSHSRALQPPDQAAV